MFHEHLFHFEHTEPEPSHSVYPNPIDRAYDFDDRPSVFTRSTNPGETDSLQQALSE